MTAVAFNPDTTDFGTDVAWNDDLAAVWGLSSGQANYIQACMLRLSQRTGSMDFYDPTYVCLDLRSYLSAKTNAADKSRLQGRIAAAIESDPRSQSCAATASFDTPTNVLTVALALQTAEGPFDLVLQASKVSVSVLSINGVPAPTLPTASTGGGATIIIVGDGGSNQPGPPGPPGASTPSRNWGLPPMSDDSGAEIAQLQSQFEVNWADFGATVTIEFDGMGSDTGAPGSGNGVFKLRINGSDGVADGTVVVTLTATSGSATRLQGSTTIANPGGTGRAIVTVKSSANGKTAALRGATFTIQGN